MSELKDRLKEAREAKGLSHRQLAQLAQLDEERHVGARHIGMIESGERDNITTETAIALCEALGVSLDWLVRGLGPGPAPDAAEPKQGAA